MTRSCRRLQISSKTSLMVARFCGSMPALGFQSLQDYVDDRIGGAGQWIVVFAQHPRGDHFVERSEEAIGRDLVGDLASKEARVLALPDDRADKIKVLHQVVLREQCEKFRTMAQFSLEHHRQGPIRPQCE